MNFSKNRIKTLLKKKNKIQSRKRFKKKPKQNKKNSFRRKNINIRKKSLKKIKIKRIAKKKRKAYIRQRGGYKNIEGYETKNKEITNILEQLPNEKDDVDEDYDAYSFDFFTEPFLSTRESLIKEFKNLAKGLPKGSGFSQEEDGERMMGKKEHDDDDIESSENKNDTGNNNTGEMEKNSNRYLKDIGNCTPETIIHVGDGTPGNRKSYLFQNNPSNCNPQDSIESLWKNLFDMGI